MVDTITAIDNAREILYTNLSSQREAASSPQERSFFDQVIGTVQEFSPPRHIPGTQVSPAQTAGTLGQLADEHGVTEFDSAMIADIFKDTSRTYGHLRSADSNSDRTVTRYEMDTYLRADPEGEPSLQKADLNADGQISLAEFRHTVSGLSRIQQALIVADTNRDGSISASEFNAHNPRTQAVDETEDNVNMPSGNLFNLRQILERIRSRRA
jgi:hypothetical protein